LKKYATLNWQRDFVLIY